MAIALVALVAIALGILGSGSGGHCQGSQIFFALGIEGVRGSRLWRGERVWIHRTIRPLE